MVNPKLAGFTVDKSHLKNSFLFLSYNTRQLPPEKMKHIIRLSDNLDSVRLGKTGTNFIYKYIWEIVLWGLERGGDMSPDFCLSTSSATAPLVHFHHIGNPLLIG
jgi:hypothetical protein